METGALVFVLTSVLAVGEPVLSHTLFLSSGRITWEEARNYCTARNGRLVSPGSNTEWTDFTALARSLSLDIFGSIYWTGIKLDNATVQCDEDTNRTPWVYSGWARWSTTGNEPNMCPEEACVRLAYAYMMTTLCSDRRQALCESDGLTSTHKNMDNIEASTAYMPPSTSPYSTSMVSTEATTIYISSSIPSMIIRETSIPVKMTYISTSISSSITSGTSIPVTTTYVSSSIPSKITGTYVSTSSLYISPTASTQVTISRISSVKSSSPAYTDYMASSISSSSTKPTETLDTMTNIFPSISSIYTISGSTLAIAFISSWTSSSPASNGYNLIGISPSTTQSLTITVSTSNGMTDILSTLPTESTSVISSVPFVTSDPLWTSSSVGEMGASSTVYTTTSIAPSENNSSYTCDDCCLQKNLTREIDQQELDEIMQLLRGDLIINKFMLSSHKRKLISVYDSRPSSVAMGGAAVAILIGIVGLLVLPDIFYLCRYLHTCTTKETVKKVTTENKKTQTKQEEDVYPIVRGGRVPHSSRKCTPLF